MMANAQTGFVQVFHLFKVKPADVCAFFVPAVNEHQNEEHEVELLRQIAAGNHAAFAEFYDRHATVMFSVACKILQNPIEAEDVMQEVFLQIWEKAKNFDSKLGRTASWTAILVRNRAIDRLRAAQRRNRLA